MKDQLVIQLGPSKNTRMEFSWIATLGVWVGKHLVTNAQYKRFDPSHDNKITSGFAHTENLPVIYVSIDNAIRYSKWMARHGSEEIPPGYTFRLPTEMEWESCARCEPVRNPPWGENCPGFDSENELMRNAEFFHRAKHRHRNKWGIEASESGLWEWTQDLYDPTMNCRILRGACWYGTVGGEKKTLYHHNQYPERGYQNVGFRLVIGHPQTQWADVKNK